MGILSNSHNFHFIHIYKTGGSSFCNLFNIPNDLPFVNRSNRKPWHYYYQAKEKDYVYRLFQDEIKLFNYSFDELTKQL